MNPSQLLAWADVVEALVSLGVRSFSVIRSAMIDAGVEADDAAIVALRAKWDRLVADVARAAGANPTP